MTTPELVNKIAEQCDVNKVAIKKVLNSLNDIIIDELSDYNSFALFKLGTLKKVKRAARICRNPQTGEKIKVAEKNTVTFKPSVTVKNAVN